MNNIIFNVTPDRAFDKPVPQTEGLWVPDGVGSGKEIGTTA